MITGFLRHAEAEDAISTDFERRLTPKGIDQAGKVAAFCRDHGLLPDLIVTSPVVRAKETAKIVAKELECDLVEERWLACGMDPTDCLREIAAFSHKDFILLVGHEPDFGDTIAHLIGLHNPSSLKIRKASLTLVDLPELVAGAGQLQFSIPARFM